MKLATTLAVAVSAASLFAQDDMIGVSFGGTAFSVSSATGVGSSLGAVGFPSLNSMARVGGTLYTMSGGSLIAINPATGVGTSVVATSPTLGDARGMAADAAGNLFVVQNGGGTTVADLLYLVDVTTGAATLLGSTTPYSGIQGLSFDLAGTLYGWDVGSGSGVGAGLVIIDIATGAATDVNPSVGNAVDVQTLALSPTGVLYGARSSLFTIDTATGIATLVGTGGYTDLRGIDFRPGADCILRNGTGINPLVCNCATLPVLGTNFDVTVAPAGNTVLTLVFAADSPLPFPVPLFGGEALINVPLGDLPATGLGTHSLALPNATQFIGLVIYLQGMRVNAIPNGLALELTNGQDAVLGL